MNSSHVACFIQFVIGGELLSTIHSFCCLDIQLPFLWSHSLVEYVLWIHALCFTLLFSLFHSHTAHRSSFGAFIVLGESVNHYIFVCCLFTLLSIHSFSFFYQVLEDQPHYWIDAMKFQWYILNFVSCPLTEGSLTPDELWMCWVHSFLIAGMCCNIHYSIYPFILIHIFI